MRTKTGVVSSISGKKTIVVTVHSYKTHPKYEKKYRISAKFHAHDEHEVARVGDTVVISETRPLSRLKRWNLVSEPSSVSSEQS